MLLFGELEEASSQERAGIEIKGESGFRDGSLFFVSGASSGVKIAEIIERQGNCCVGVNDLGESAVEESETGAKNVVATDHFLDRTLE
jgi:hypothetical protein